MLDPAWKQNPRSPYNQIITLGLAAGAYLAACACVMHSRMAYPFELEQWLCS